MKIAAITITYNRKDVLVQCIQSILKSEVKPDGIIVVDNASTDGTREKIEEEFKEVTLIRLDENKGPAGGAEAGQRFAIKNGFDAVWMLDDDVEVHEKAFKELISYYDRLKKEYRKIFLTSVSFGDREFKKQTFDILLYNSKTGLTKRMPEENYSKEFFQFNATPMRGLFIPREIFDEAGYFRTEFFGWYDDTEFVLRAQKQGFKGFAIPSSKIYHPVLFRKRVKILGKNFTFFAGRPQIMYYGTRNNIISQREFLPWFNFYFIFLPIFVARRAGSILIFYENKITFLKHMLKGIIEALRIIRR